MTSNYSSGRHAQGMMFNSNTANYWAVQGNTASEPVYDSNFEADIDIDAVAQDSTGDDSGYYLNDFETFEGNTSDFATHNDDWLRRNVEVNTTDSGCYSNDAEALEGNTSEFANHNGDSLRRYVEVKAVGSIRADIFCVDATGSNHSNHGSIYDGTMTKSTTYIERGTSHGKNLTTTQKSKTVCQVIQGYENQPPHKYSAIDYETSDLRPVERWTTKHEPHEWMAYRLQQPAHPRRAKKHQ